MQVLAVVDGPEHVCYRYRLRAFEPALRRAGASLTPVTLARAPLTRLRQLLALPRVDVLVIQRKLLPAWQVRLLRGKARRLVFDFDDAVLYRDSYDPRGPESPRRSRRFAAVVGMADLVSAGNPFLADCALKAGARPDRVRVIPTCVDTTLYTPTFGKPGSDGLDLAWIGSSSTLQGLESRADLFQALARSVPGLRLRLICDRFPAIGGMEIVPVPWSEPNEASDLAAGDAGLGLIPDDLWSRGKCGLKILQYQAAGLPVLANPVGVHPRMVQPGVNGFLPSTIPEWVDAVRTLADDPALRRRMGRAARASVEADYSVRAWQDEFVAAICGTRAATTGSKFPRSTMRHVGDTIGAEG